MLSVVCCVLWVVWRLVCDVCCLLYAVVALLLCGDGWCRVLLLLLSGAM